MKLNKLFVLSALALSCHAFATTPPALPSAPEIVPKSTNNGASSAISELIGKNINQDECSIWLCLPGGFPEGCGKALSAMKKRLKKGKSPLPSFSSCSADGNDHGLYHYEKRVYKIEEHEVCTKETEEFVHEGFGCMERIWKIRKCQEFQKVAQHWVENTRECAAVNSPHITLCNRRATRADITQYGKKITEGFFNEGNWVTVDGWDGKLRRKVGEDTTSWKFLIKDSDCSVRSSSSYK